MTKKRIISLIVIGMLLSSVSVLATYLIESSDVGYDNSESELVDSEGNQVTDVQTAIDVLLKKVGDESSGSLTISLNSQDGNEEQSKSPVIGTLPKLTQTGKTFVGWFTEAEGGTQVTTETEVTEDITLYAHWVNREGKLWDDGYVYYTTPVTVYYNPTSPSDTCTSSNSSSTTGTKTGCMKWYAYSEKNGIVNMILDHNINSGTGLEFINSVDFSNSSTLGAQLGVSGMCSASWNSVSGTTCRGPLTLLKYIEDNTSGWKTFVQGDYATYTASTSTATYSINYLIDYDDDGVKDYKARLITAQEVAYIKGESWTESSSTSIISVIPDWLYTNLSSSTSGLYGYWTSSPYPTNTINAWFVNYNSNLGYNNRVTVTFYGVRPVISVSSSIIYSN